jgi:hypothetical protein
VACCGQRMVIHFFHELGEVCLFIISASLENDKSIAQIHLLQWKYEDARIVIMRNNYILTTFISHE